MGPRLFCLLEALASALNLRHQNNRFLCALEGQILVERVDLLVSRRTKIEISFTKFRENNNFFSFAVSRANHFQISMPRGYIHHYHVSITPDKCPRKVNRDIIATMVNAYGRIFGTKKPVFDGRSNL